MAYNTISSVVPLLCLLTVASTKPIMVSFGTNQGPIVPREPKAATAQSRSIVPTNPAPVFEEREDVPNPNQYKPMIPHQYRAKLYSHKPQADLILGTPLDQIYTPSIEKANLQRKEFARNLNLGVAYTGPHIFEKQDYEIYETKKKILPLVKHTKPQYYWQIRKVEDQYKANTNSNTKFVPQIGILYSAGVRYYVPQLVYYNPQQHVPENPDEENSVYDEHDVKYQH